MTTKYLSWFFVPIALFMGGCATIPTGPSVMALPGSGKDFNQFRADDAACRQYALSQIGGATPSQAANQSAVASAVAGTALGAATGALLGGHRGAAAGAGAGLLIGSMAGSEAAHMSSYQAQRLYNNYYVQCMYANGNRVPISRRMLMHTREPEPEDEEAGPSGPVAPGPPPDGAIPPPPLGPPPPPPPGW